MCHAVEVEYNGNNICRVVYVASVPTTPINTEYMKNQRQDFLKGVSLEYHRGAVSSLLREN